MKTIHFEKGVSPFFLNPLNTWYKSNRMNIERKCFNMFEKENLLEFLKQDAELLEKIQIAEEKRAMLDKAANNHMERWNSLSDLIHGYKQAHQRVIEVIKKFTR